MVLIYEVFMRCGGFGCYLFPLWTLSRKYNNEVAMKVIGSFTLLFTLHLALLSFTIFSGDLPYNKIPFSKTLLAFCSIRRFEPQNLAEVQHKLVCSFSELNSKVNTLTFLCLG